MDDGDLLQAKSVEILRSNRRDSILLMTLLEGKNREIRRMCFNLGHEVTELKRISFGDHELADLKPGEFRLL